MEMQRYLINQPSTLQKHHKLHGEKVLGEKSDKQRIRIYFFDRDLLSMMIDKSALSKR